jgi:uncharacterized membrane protein YdjX (TVP38/TMEM64 family)
VNGILTFLSSFAAAHPLGAVISFVLLRAFCVIYPPAPGLPADLAAIGLFGLSIGFELAEVGIMLGATIAFALGRCARQSVAMPMSRPHFIVLAERVGRSVDDEDSHQQFDWWFTVRLLTNPLFDPLSYAAGLTRTRFYPFFLGTLLGNIPSIAVFFVAADYGIGAGVWTLVAITGLFAVAIWYIAGRWLTRLGFSDEHVAHNFAP